MLPSIAIKYSFLGGQLGGRPEGDHLYHAGGEPDYEAIRREEFYQAGLARLIELIARERLVLIMCSERDPEKCHRKLLITPDLQARGVRVGHVR